MGETLDGQICVGICVRERNEGVTLALRQQVSRKTGKENLQDNASRKSGPGIQEAHAPTQGKPGVENPGRQDTATGGSQRGSLARVPQARPRCCDFDAAAY